MTSEYGKELLSFSDMLYHYGWPQWDSVNTPPRTNWWENEIKQFHTFGNTNPRVAIIEVIGTPQGGKTTLIAELQSRLADELNKRNTELVIHEEPLVPITDNHEFVLQTIPTPPEVEEAIMPVMMEKPSWATSFAAQHYKTQWTQHHLIQESQSMPDRNKILVIYRGATDAAIWYHTMAAHAGDPNFELPNEYKHGGIHHDILRMLVTEAHVVSQKVDTTVLIGTSQQVAKKRRAGKSYPGWVTDSAVYNDYLAWQGYWLAHVYPNLTNKGVLTINGENSLDENSSRFTKYLLEVSDNVLPQW